MEWERIVTGLRDRLSQALAAPRGRYRPLRVDGFAAGWIDDARATRLARFVDCFDVGDSEIAFAAKLGHSASRTAALEHVTRALAADGLLTAWRDERYAVAPRLGDAPLFLVERAAARFFGIVTYAAHANGLVADGASVRMWIARRSPTKAIDPSMLDNLVGGGIAAGATVQSSLVKEAWEEAGVPAAVATLATAAGEVRICREQPDGLQREIIFVHDLWLDADFVPVNQDGEAVGHRLVKLIDAARLIANDQGADLVTADASLVMLDFLLRHGSIGPDAPEYSALDALRRPSLDLGAW